MILERVNDLGEVTEKVIGTCRECIHWRITNQPGYLPGQWNQCTVNEWADALVQVEPLGARVLTRGEHGCGHWQG